VPNSKVRKPYKGKSLREAAVFPKGCSYSNRHKTLKSKRLAEIWGVQLHLRLVENGMKGATKQ
jgi:hypothetical protein